MPHIFISTPESLALVLSSPVFSLSAKAVEFLIVDEIHALANKRGVYLSLTLERLCAECAKDPCRIGLSATISTLEEAARFLVGVNRECLIAEVKLDKKIELELGFLNEEVLEFDSLEGQRDFYAKLDEIIESNKTSLIFTNTRAFSEKVLHFLKEYFPDKYAESISTHHGALSKENRFETEEKLRNGQLKAVVCSSSLELGIDI